jgi:MFS family permease
LRASPRSAGLVSRYGPKAVGTAGMLVITAAITGYALLGTTTPIWVLGLFFALQGVGIGVAMPSATAAVMDVLPRERAGAGSALTNTSRQVGVALGVAVLGSILAEAYRGQLRPALSVLPAAARGVASQSVAATQAAAQQLGARGHGLLGPADLAFTHAMHITTLVAAAISLAGALVVLRWMPGKVAERTAKAQPAAKTVDEELDELTELSPESAAVEG